MIDALLSLKVIKGPFPLVVELVGAAAFLAVLFLGRPWRRSKRWWPVAGMSFVAGGILGYVACWLMSVVIDIWGVALSIGSVAWFVVASAAIGVAVARLFFLPPRWITAVIASIAVFTLVGLVGINIDLGEYPLLKDALGVGRYGKITLPAVTNDDPVTLKTWTAPADMPDKGRIGTVTIPASANFKPRSALVYLPPAALVANPPKLPVLEMFSGQPGGPDQWFTSGNLAVSVNAYAKLHHGLAPIIVVPDQLSHPNRNPMCVDSPLGDAATYTAVDVPRWIRHHLNVLEDRRYWAVGGFSEGGTCAIQLGAAHTAVFGNILDIAGETKPKNGTVQETIDLGFGGSKARYEAAAPQALLAANAPYADTLGIFAVGGDDQRFGPGMEMVTSYAAAAGISVRRIVYPNGAHDWNTVKYSVDTALPMLGRRWGLHD